MYTTGSQQGFFLCTSLVSRAPVQQQVENTAVWTMYKQLHWSHYNILEHALVQEDACEQ